MLINNATYQRETLSERPIRQSLNGTERLLTKAEQAHPGHEREYNLPDIAAKQGSLCSMLKQWKQ